MKNTFEMSSNKSFGIVFFIVFFIISTYPLVNNGEIRLWFLIISLIFLILGLMNSKILMPLNKIWFKFGILLGKLISPLIMLIIFFLVLTPIGLILRIFGKDVINLKFDKTKSYWIKKNNEINNMKNQF